MKIFVIGDIHGAFKSLLQCLERSGFDYKKDHLIVLGDVCDGYPEVKQCIDELLKIKHCDFIIGNHDLWALDWATKGKEEKVWLDQGGRNTKASYGGSQMLQEHIAFLKDAHTWLELDKNLFVHGGFNPFRPIEGQGRMVVVWDRDLLYDAQRKWSVNPEFRYDGYEEIFVGHTPTQGFGSLEPINFCNVWDLDTGAGWSGRLTIMDVNSHKFWQSDLSQDLYGLPQG